MTMTTHHIGRIVVGCLAGGVLAALALVAGPFAGADEHVITGIVLLAFASSWGLLAALSMLWTDQPQRWAALPAGFMGVAGAGVLVFAPSEAVIMALGWIWPPLFLAVLGVTVVRVREALHSRTRSWVVYPLLTVCVLSALGAGYQAVRESLDRRTPSAPGRLIDVGGHRLYLNCTGSGNPTVVLQSGLGEGSAYWESISTAVARDTQVCVYDRAGRGWSEPPSVPQDGVAIARDLHVLLERADVQGPFVLVGHSSGAQYVRIFAGRYPEQVAGVVLLDGQPAEAFEGLPIFPLFYRVFSRVYALLPSLARLGVGRLLGHPDWSPRAARSLHDEFAELPTSLAQARAFQSLGDRPLVVVTASRDAMAGWLPLQDAMAKLSTNSRHEVVPFEHTELVTGEMGARTSSQAIRDVVHSVRFAAPLAKS